MPTQLGNTEDLACRTADLIFALSIRRDFIAKSTIIDVLNTIIKNV